MTSSKAGWEREARNWAAWARTPGHDAYWQVRDAFFQEIVERPGRATLEVGCGEGRVARDLRDRDHRVTAIDASPTLIELAREADAESEYVLADAAALPFADASFDLVVAHNSLMDVDDLPASVAEAARVLAPDGRFAISIAHPLVDAGRWESPDPDARFVVSRSYFERRQLEERFARDGLEITFHGWVRTLEDYMRALELANLVVVRMREPTSEGWRQLDFLHLLAVRR